MSSINQLNVAADKLVYGKWSDVNTEYFSNPKIIEDLYNRLEASLISLPKNIDIVEFGSAEGVVGEYFKNRLASSHNVQLTIVDTVKEHLDNNTNADTIKICEDVLLFKSKEVFDLAIARSLLHYFSQNDQVTVLRNIHESLKSDGYLLLAAFIQNSSDLQLFLTLNRYVGKHLELLSEIEVKKIIDAAGFSDVIFLGDAPVWNCTSENLRLRYSLSDDQVEEMRLIIETAAPEDKKGFTVSEKGFTVPVPYKIYLAKK